MKQPKQVKISMFMIATLIFNVIKAAKDPKIDHVDANRTLDQLLSPLNRRIYIDTEILESALFCCNLLGESGKFKSIKDEKFKTFIAKYLPHDLEFDTQYNVIKYRGPQS